MPCTRSGDTCVGCIRPLTSMNVFTPCRVTRAGCSAVAGVATHTFVAPPVAMLRTACHPSRTLQKSRYMGVDAPDPPSLGDM